jgi:hypothetical protein
MSSKSLSISIDKNEMVWKKQVSDDAGSEVTSRVMTLEGE